jgi:hypothetical protein
MPKKILMEEFHLSIAAPADLPNAEYHAIVRTLRSKRFQPRLRNAVRDLFRHYPSLKKIQLSISQ